MIKIQEHLNREDAEIYLNSLANEMWESLNIKKVNKEYNEYSLIKKIEKVKNKLKEDDYFKEYAKNDKSILKKQKDFINYLQDNNCEKLKDLITLKPNELLKLKKEILGIADQNIFTEPTTGEQTKFSTLLLTDLFNYKNFRQSKKCYQLLIDANLNNVTCPYCNENSIRVIDISEEKDEEVINKAYLDLDHFYPKSQHPYFALSYYNLIPCCHTCNSSEKGNKDFCIETHQQPFYESFNDNYTFEINPRFAIDRSTDYLKLVKNESYRDDFSDRDLRLSLRYKTHLALINKFIKHYFNYYYKDPRPDFNKDWEDVILKDVPKENHEILSMRLGKMYKDIFDQIKVD